MKTKWWIMAALLASAACGRPEPDPPEGEPPSATQEGTIRADTAVQDMTGPEGTRVGQ